MKRNTGAKGIRRTKLLKLGATSSAFFLPIILAAAYLNMGQTCCGSNCPPPPPTTYGVTAWTDLDMTWDEYGRGFMLAISEAGPRDRLYFTPKS
jgi:hypothetical protein